MIWDFLQRYDESWIWRCTGSDGVRESGRNFAVYEECVSDAMLHGYVKPRDTQRGVGTVPVRARRKRKAARSAMT